MLCSPNGNRGSSTHIQTGQTIPTEDMFATFTHHLGTAFILFDGHRTHGTTLDEVIIEWYTNIILTIGCQTTTVLLASNIRMPLPRRSRDITRMDKRKTNAFLKLEEVGYSTYLFKGPGWTMLFFMVFFPTYRFLAGGTEFILTRRALHGTQ